MKVAQSCLTLRPRGLPSPWNYPGMNTGVVAVPFSRDLPNLGIEPRPPHCRRILYQLSHQGTPWYETPKFVFILSPNGSFPPVVYLPVSQIISVILSFAPVSGGPCHFKKKSLSFLWQTCGWFHRDTVLLSYQNYGRRRTSIFLYKALEDDLVTLRHLNK